jgi:hypothetical protein
MRHIHPAAFLLLTVLFPTVAMAQQVQWLTTAPIDWLQYPSTPGDLVSARDPDHVFASKLDAISYAFNHPMGPNTLSRQLADGATLWSLTLGDSVQVESIASDDDGNVYLGGRYFNRLLVDGDAVLSVPEGHSSAGSFLCAFDAAGQLLWQQDVSGGPIDAIAVASLASDHQGRMWVALSTFFGARIVRLNTDGTQAEDRTLVDSKSIGAISFDPWGGLYVSGAAESPDITVNGTVFAVTQNYAFFVTRMNAAGVAQWVRTAEDITFQEPVVQADASGHALLLGTYFQPLTWGSIPFADPLWSQGFFLARVDSLGSFDWGVSPPNSPGSGQFSLANGNALGVDGEGNSYVLGNVNGTLDWGSGISTGSGPDITARSSALISFDPSGAPRWGLSGGSTGTDPMYGISVTADGVAHIAGIAAAPFTLGAFTVDPGTTRGAVVARIDPELSTGGSMASVPQIQLVAVPSLFTTGFRIHCNGDLNSSTTIVELIDATGRIAQRIQGFASEFGNGLATGTYTVVVRDGTHSLRTRVVKE